MSISSRLAPHQRVFASFAVYAFGLGQIYPRLPDVKAAMGLSEAENIAGFIYIGTAETPPKERQRPDVENLTEFWTA
jgi:hypothetical protein